MSESLFERLGGTEGITKIANDVVDNHVANKTIATRFAESDIPALKNAAAHFSFQERVVPMFIRERIC